MKKKINFIIFIDIINKYKFYTISNIKKINKKKFDNLYIKYKNIEISSKSSSLFNKKKEKKNINFKKNIKLLKIIKS